MLLEIAYFMPTSLSPFTELKNSSEMMSIASDELAIIIPVYNEAPVIKQVVEQILELGFTCIIVVDDGSKDKTSEVVAQLPVHYLRHKLNRGKGAAAKTGLQAAKELQAKIIVTIDGDGQHDPTDIMKLVAPIQADLADISLGTRLINRHQMPWYKKVANSFGDLVTRWLYGVRVIDSQSGFRAFSAAAAQALNVRSDAYAYDSEVISEIGRHKFRYAQVPITVLYTPYSMNKLQKQNFLNGIKTLYTMLWNVIS